MLESQANSIGASVCPAAPKSQAEQTMQALESSIHAAHVRVAQLHGRLESVLFPEAPGEPGCGSRVRSSAPLLGRIDSSAEQLESLVGRLDDLLQRLAL